MLTLHDGGNGKGIQWLVESNGKKRTESPQPQPRPVLKLRNHACRECNAIDQRMQHETKEQANPADPSARIPVLMRVMVPTG